MEIKDVTTSATQVRVGDPIRVAFRVEGALPNYFKFPFSNESLTEKLIEFIKEVKR